jgi:DNA-binding response OmpR family regulator
MPTTVLVVDDHELVRALVSRFLVREGYEVTSAADGDAALDAVAIYRPDVVVTSTEIRDSDGVVLAERLRERGDGPPVVLMAETADGVAIPDVPVLVKPFEVGLLLETVADSVSRA